MPDDKKISELTNYTPPIDTDSIPILDITVGTAKRITWANIKATLKTYFDTLYAVLSTALTLTGAQTVTNKRITKRHYTTTSLATLTPEIDTYDMFSLTAQAEALNIANHSTSTPTAGESILIDILPDATPRALTYGTNYVALSGVAKPTTTVASKRMQLLFIWLADVSKFTLAWVGNE